MSTLTIHLQAGTDQHLVPVEIIDGSGRRPVTRTMADGDSATLELGPGTYVVQAVTPAGRLLAGQAEIGEDSGAEITLAAQPETAPVDRPRPDAAPGQTVLQRFARQLRRNREARSALAERPEEDAGRRRLRVDPEPVLPQPREESPAWAVRRRRRPAVPARAGPPPAAPGWADELWVCLWSHDGTRWQPVRWPDAPVQVDGRRISARLRLSPRTLHALVIGGPTVGSTVVVLPPAPEVSVHVTRDDEEIAVAARTPSAGVESLLAYLTSGQLVAAGELADEVLDEAERMLWGKVSDPLGAVVGALYLLRTRDLDRMHDWPRNLADWNPWLPDASVIRAAQLLTLPEVPRDEVRDRLLQAVSAGIPVYTDSLHRLVQGLVRLAGERADDEAVTAALERIWPYARTCEWQLPLTTFPGTDPAHPLAEDARVPIPPSDVARPLA